MLRIESYRRGIVLSTIFNVFNKGLVFVNSLLIAYYFGTQLKMDIYFYAFNTIMIIATFISSVNSAVIIPESMRVRIQEGEDKAIKFLNIFIYAYFALTFLLCVIFMINPVKIFITFSKYDAAALQPQVSLLYMSIPLLMLMPVTTLLTDILASYRFFTIPVIASIINSLFSLVFVVLFHNMFDAKSILLGLLISYSLNIIILFYLMFRFAHWKFSVSKNVLQSRVVNNILFSQTGNFLTSLGSYAPLYFLSGTVTGIIAALNYAQQIVAQANSFIIYQISVVTRIKLSELYAHKEFEKVNDIFISTIKFLLFILVPVSALLFLYAKEIVKVLFERGSFTETSAILSSDMLRYLALSLPFLAIISIAGNLYVAAQLIKMSIIYQVISNLLLIGLIALCVHNLGYIGYPIAYLAINVLNVLVVYVYCKYFFPFIHYLKILKYLLFMVVVNLAIMSLLLLLNRYENELGILLTMCIGGTVYLVILLGLNLKFQLNNDFNLILLKILDRIRPVKHSS